LFYKMHSYKLITYSTEQKEHMLVNSREESSVIIWSFKYLGYAGEYYL